MQLPDVQQLEESCSLTLQTEDRMGVAKRYAPDKKPSQPLHLGSGVHEILSLRTVWLVLCEENKDGCAHLQGRIVAET